MKRYLGAHFELSLFFSQTLDSLAGPRFVVLDRSANEREELTCRLHHFHGCSTSVLCRSCDTFSFLLECTWAHLVASGRSLGFVLLGCPEAHRLEGPEATCSKAESQGSPEASRQGGPEAVRGLVVQSRRDEKRSRIAGSSRGFPSGRS